LIERWTGAEVAITQRITLIVHAPELVENDGRPLAVVQGMERAFPGLRLDWTTAEDGKRTHLTNRDEWLSQQRLKGTFPLLHNGNYTDFASVNGWEGLAAHSSGGQAQLEVHGKLPLTAEAFAAAAAVLEGVGEAARAYWGHATPFRASLEIARQTRDPVLALGPPERGLPAIKLSRDISSPEIPHRLGWLSYWSAGAARAIGFPDPARDAELLSRAKRTASGGWVVQLTEAPLDLDIPAHLDALLRAYERFPRIGGCVPAR
jgi:hypothetical protein